MHKVCVDKILSRDLALPLEISALSFRRLRAITPLNKQWPIGHTITIAFLGGTQAQREMVKSIAPEWTKKCNLKFVFKESLPAMIRISFDESDGAWSYLGLDNLDIPSPAATMNFGWLDSETIQHEFGHCIGLSHEHQNPLGGILWNEQAVIKDLSGPPNYWSESTIRHNVLQKYSVDQIMGTEFDPASIMLYAFPATWTLNGVATSWNQVISEKDAAFVSSAKMYPFAQVPVPTKIQVSQATPETISVRAEQDEFTFDVAKAGIHYIETAGSTDVFLSLYRDGALIASDDDSGRGSNSRIEAQLSPGTYRVVVRHYSKIGTGGYRVIVWS